MVKKIIYPTLLGTTAMTAFSYLVSEQKDKNFKEPELLARWLKELDIDLNKKDSRIAGMAAHYMVGLMFVTIYIYLWENTKADANIITGIGLGAASGLCGIAAWELTLKLYPNPALKNKKQFFGQLFIAHIIFGAFAAMGYGLARK